MKFYRFLLPVVVSAMFIGAGDDRDSIYKCSNRNKKPIATPTPPIDEDDEVIKVDTEAVNVLFTAQDKNRRLLLTLKPDGHSNFRERTASRGLRVLETDRSAAEPCDPDRHKYVAGANSAGRKGSGSGFFGIGCQAGKR